jgi:hypothetical protein
MNADLQDSKIHLYPKRLIPAKLVIPAKAGIQEKTGFRVKPGMTNAIRFMSSYIDTLEPSIFFVPKNICAYLR